ncbi:unnamed protein product, partial [Ascophyllum nodosum]
MSSEVRRSREIFSCFDDKRRHRRLIGHQSRTFDFQFHPVEQVAISASEDGTGRVWDLSTGKCGKVLAANSREQEVLRACWAPPGEACVAATGSADGIVRLWGIAGGSNDGPAGVERYRALKVVGSLHHRNEAKGLDGQVYSCQFVPEHAAGGATAGATRLLTASDQSVHLWDVETCKRVASRALSKVGDHSIGGERNPSDLSFVFDAKPRPRAGSDVLAVALSDGTVRVGDVLRGRSKPSVLRGRSTAQTGLAWSDDGTILASCGGDGAVTVWDARTWRIRSTLCGHSRPVYGVVFYPSEGGESEEASTQLLLSWSSDETICMWDASRAPDNGTALPLATISVEPGFPIYSCSVSADGRRLAVAGGGPGKAGFLGVPVKLVDLS